MKKLSPCAHNFAIKLTLSLMTHPGWVTWWFTSGEVPALASLDSGVHLAIIWKVLLMNSVLHFCSYESECFGQCRSMLVNVLWFVVLLVCVRYCSECVAVLGVIIGICLSDLFNSMENSVHGKSVSNIGHLLSFCRQLGWLTITMKGGK